MSHVELAESSHGWGIESSHHWLQVGGDIYLIVNVAGVTHIYGINSATGTTLFDVALSNASHISVGPTGRVYVTRTVSNEIVRIDPTDGATLATYSVTSPRRATCNGSLIVYGAQTPARFAAVDEDFAAEQWTYTTDVAGKTLQGIDIDANGNSYWATGTATTGFVVKLNSSGAEQWKVNPPAGLTFRSRPVYYGGYLFVYRTNSVAGDHKIVKLSATDGSELASIVPTQVAPYELPQPYTICTANDGKAYLVYLIEDKDGPPFDTGVDVYQVQRFASDLSSMEEAYDTFSLDNFVEFVVPTGNIIVSRNKTANPSPTTRQVDCLTIGLDRVWVKDIGSSPDSPLAGCGGYLARP